MPWGQIWPHPGVTNFTWAYEGKTLEISLYLAIKPTVTKFLHVTLSSGPSVRDLNYSPKVELIAKDNKFYIGLFYEIFRNLFC